MRKLLILIVIAATAGTGAFLATGYGQDNRSESWVRSHLAVIQDQLSSLAKHLRQHRDSHGQYPTNDQGLAALDNFESRFMVTFHRPADGLLADGLGADAPWRFERFWWETSREAITEYRGREGHPPRNAEEFSQTRLGLNFESNRSDDSPGVPIEIAIGADNNVFVLDHAGVLSPWRLPYVYENRKGLDARLFDGSPADSDHKRLYSTQVDDGVFIYSVGGQIFAQRLDQMWWERNTPRMIGGGLLLAAFVLTALLLRSSKKAAGAGLIVLIASGAAGAGMHLASHTTCYVMSPLFHRRDAAMVDKQRQLLDKYHQSGVLGDEAYRKALAAIQQGPATQPAGSTTRPD